MHDPVPDLPRTCADCGMAVDPANPWPVCANCGALLPPCDPQPADQDGDACIRRGVEAYQRGDYYFAVSELQQALTLPFARSSLAEVLTLLGNACDQLDQFQRAIFWFRRALADDPAFFRAWVGMGIAYRHLGDYPEAERCYTQAIRIDPKYAEAHASLGVLYVHHGEVTKAIAALETAIRLDPALATAHGSLALAYAMARRFDDAERELQQAIILGYANHPVVRERIDALRGEE